MCVQWSCGRSSPATSQRTVASPLLLTLKLPADRGTESAEQLDVRGALFAIAALGLLSHGLIATGAGNGSAGVIAFAAALPAT